MYTVIRTFRKITYMHITTYISVNFLRTGKMVKMWHFVRFFGALLWPNGLIFSCYDAIAVNLTIILAITLIMSMATWNEIQKAMEGNNVELFWCNCAWNIQMSLMINTLQGGKYYPPSGQHVGTASNMWEGKSFNLNRPGLISFNGRGGMIKIGQFLGPSIAGREYRDSSLDLWSSNELRFFSLKRILCRRLL